MKYMKYLKLYEAFDEDNYPNNTDKEYWVYDYKDGDGMIKLILKFVEYDSKYNGEYFFDVITLTPFENFEIGDKVDVFYLYGSGIRQYQKEGTLRLASPEEIKKFEIYNKMNKYNL